jgi:hypothetical protein
VSDPLVLRVLPNGQALARNCKICRSLFPLNPCMRDQITCSIKCRNENIHRNIRACGKRRYIKRHGLKPTMGNCVICGHMFEFRNFGGRCRQVCSEPCARQRNELYKPTPAAIVKFNCLFCGAIGYTDHGRRYCSDQCKKRQHAKLFYARHRDQQRERSSERIRQIVIANQLYRKLTGKSVPGARRLRAGRDAARWQIYQSFKQLGLMPATTETDDGTC